MKNNIKYGEWLWQWYRLYKKESISEKSQNQYERAFIMHVPKNLFDKPLIEVNALDIDIALYNLGRTRTAKYLYNIYCASLHKAYVLDFIPKDISELITRPNYTSKKSKPLTDKEILLFFNSLRDNDLYYFYKFLLLTGCRRSEALQLEYSDIDKKNKIIHIRGTKTANSDRFIPYTKSLEDLFESMPYLIDKQRVFPFNANYVTKFFHKKMPNHKLHDLRHTFATRCAEQGLHPAVTQSLLGHSTPEFTLKVYTHINCTTYMTDLDEVQRSYIMKKNEK